MKRYVPWIIGLLILAAFLFALPSALTIVPIEQVEALAQSEVFDAAAYVETNWQSRILPTAEENSVELTKVLNAIEVDDTGLAKKDQLVEVANEFGSITVGEAHVYLVKGRGTVTAVDTESRTGTMTVDLEGYDGPIQVQIYLGPRIPSDATAVRDSVGFINFGDFREQTEYGKVANEINKRIATEVLEPLDEAALVGKTIEFIGAVGIRTFNLIDISLATITVVPVKVSVVE
jgi:predicted lipoprotein